MAKRRQSQYTAISECTCFIAALFCNVAEDQEDKLKRFLKLSKSFAKGVAKDNPKTKTSHTKR